MGNPAAQSEEISEKDMDRWVDISEAYALFTNKKQFQKELKEFMAGHMRRKALIERLVKAGIWEDK